MGLIPTLTKRLGMLRKLSKHMNRHNIKIFAEGIVMSKMRHLLPIMMNVWDKKNIGKKERK